MKQNMKKSNKKVEINQNGVCKIDGKISHPYKTEKQWSGFFMNYFHIEGGKILRVSHTKSSNITGTPHEFEKE